MKTKKTKRAKIGFELPRKTMQEITNLHAIAQDQNKKNSNEKHKKKETN